MKDGFECAKILLEHPLLNINIKMAEISLEELIINKINNYYKNNN